MIVVGMLGVSGMVVGAVVLSGITLSAAGMLSTMSLPRRNFRSRPPGASLAWVLTLLAATARGAGCALLWFSLLAGWLVVALTPRLSPISPIFTYNCNH